MSRASPSPSERAVIYGICALAISLLHSLFVSFFVDYYVRRQMMAPQSTVAAAAATGEAPSGDAEGGEAGNGHSQLHFTAFVAGQAIYAVWNSFNDLGFGWWGDTHYSAVNRRRFARIALGGPLLAATFVLLWVPWPTWVPPFVQFTTCLVAYDGFFSFTTVAFRALLADITSSPRERERCNAYAAVGHVVGSLGVGLASFLYEGSPDLLHFRILTAVVAALSACCFLVVSSPRYTETALQTRHQPEARQPTLLAFLRSSATKPNMAVAIVVWAVQDYSCAFATNFFSLFLATTSGSVFSPGWRSVIVQTSFIVPHLGTIILTPLVPKFGLRSIVRALFGARFLVCAAIWLLHQTVFVGSAAAANRSGDVVPRVGAILFAGLLLANRVTTEAVCRLQPLVLSDLIDEDTMVHDRPASMAAAITGMTNLASRPSESLAPVITCAFLAAHSRLFRSVNTPHGGALDEPTAFSTAASVVWIVAVTGMITSGAMLIVWQRYNLDGRHLQLVRRYIEKRTGSGPAVL